MKSSTIEAWGRGVNKIKEACDKYLELLNGKEDLHLGQNDQDVTKIMNKIQVSNESAHFI